MPGMDGVVRGRLGAPAVGRPLDRLAWVHSTSTFGDALVAVALAGTLFFAVPVAAARPRVALYLLLTVAPFAVVAPLLGRLLDGRSGAGRLALAAAMALRAALAALAVARTQSLLLYPLAFGLLVCSRAHGISRTAMVPELLGPDARDLVAVNGRMARVAALGGTAGALLGVGLDRLLGGGAVLWAAALAFTAGGVLALALPRTRQSGPASRRVPRWGSVADRRKREDGLSTAPQDPAATHRDPMDRRTARLARPPGRLRLARTPNATERAVGGGGGGGVVGAFLLPRAARLVREDGLLAGGLLLCGTTAGLLAGRVGVAAAAAGGLAMGAGIAAARLGFESLVQREVAPAARGTAITRAETTFQLAWVAGAVVPVAFPLPTTPSLLAAAAVCLLAATIYTTGLLRLGRRRVPSR